MKLKHALPLVLWFFYFQISAIAQPISFPNKECLADTQSHGIYWPVSGECRAILVCVHGLGLCAKSYEDLGEQLAQKDIATFAIDVRGFGDCRHNDKNYSHLDLNGTVTDLEKMLVQLANRYPGVPIFVLGESMGGAITMKLASLKPKQLSGIICSAPAWKMYKEKRTVLKALASWSPIRPTKVSLAAQAIMDEATTKKELRQRWVADDSARLDLTPTEALQFLSFIRGTANCAKKIDNIPVLITQGLRDHLVRVDGAADLFHKIPSADKELLLISDAEHLVFEEGQFSNLIVNTLQDWLITKSQNSNKLAYGVYICPTGYCNQAAKLFHRAKIENISLLESGVALVSK